MAVPSADGRAVEFAAPPAQRRQILADQEQDADLRIQDAGERRTRVPDRTRIDGLAIGAPVTAAFVGVMLAKGELAGAAFDGDRSTIAAAGGRQTELAGTGPGKLAGNDGALQEEAGDVAGAAYGQAAALDPVSVGEQPLAGGGAGPIPGSEGSIPLSEASAAGDPGRAPGAGPQISVTFGSGGLLPGFDEAITAAADNLEPIGDYTAGDTDDDVIHGTDGSDHLLGGAGDDIIHGLGGSDHLDGGAGDDQLSGGAGNDTLLGGTGDDLLDGGADDDLLFGGDGSDTLSGGTGSDQLDGGDGNDSLDGGTGADRLLGGSGDDLLIVDNQNDLALERGYGSDGGGSDVLQVQGSFGDQAVTFVFGSDLDDALPDGVAGYHQQVDPEIENLVLNGSMGHDAIGDARNNSLIGNAGDNVLFGAAGDDFLSGGAGHDRLDGGLGDDELQGGLGDDILAGSSGADRLYGGDGDDLLSGGLDADQLYGGAGNDTFAISLHDNAVDTVFDHEGSNHIRLEGVTDQAVQAVIVGDDLYLIVDANPVAVVSGYVGHEDSFAGVDLGDGIIGVDQLLPQDLSGLSEEAAIFEPEPAGPVPGDLLASYLSAPSMAGGNASDQLIGTDAADWLSGLAGDDDLQGGDGADVLEGGDGSDWLRGGAGDDRYLFKSGQSGLDTISDAEGSNIAELDGFAGARLEGVVVGHDLVVVADYAPIFKVENYVGNEASFAGVQVDDSFVPSEDLLS
jgi:Ca2+-binding RTX toxin-like protein